MKARFQFHNHAVTAFFAALVAAGAAVGALLAPSAAVADDREKVLSLLERLGRADDPGEAQRIESEITIEWSKSGSPAIDLLYQRGQDALANGDSQAAIEHLTAALDHDPAFLAARNLRAAAYFSVGQVGPAMADLALVLEAEPRHFQALAGLATLFEETGQKQKALEAYRMAAQIHPFLEEVNAGIARLEAQIEGREI